MNNFTFKTIDGGVPEVTINGRKLTVVTCVYTWVTSNNVQSGINNILVSGYFDDFILIVNSFELDYKTGKAILI